LWVLTLITFWVRELTIADSSIVNWELELYDTQPAQLGGLDHEFIFAGRIDDRLCAFAAIEALVASSDTGYLVDGQRGGADDASGIIKIVGLFDDEEIGSLLRQGARSNLLPSTIERVGESLSPERFGADLLARTYANSFLISADVTHAVNPNYLDQYLENHAPQLNTGVAIQADPNGHTTTDSVSTALLQAVADKCGSVLQLFQIRNDSRSGGTVGPTLSSAMGMRSVDAGLPQLSMHSIRATTGSKDPGLGVKLFKGFFDHFEEVDREFV
jgi:aminopeptidase I